MHTFIAAKNLNASVVKGTWKELHVLVSWRHAWHGENLRTQCEFWKQLLP